jgi:hypothetical protein
MEITEAGAEFDHGRPPKIRVLKVLLTHREVAMANKKCAHPPCDCNAGRGEPFCSVYCRQAGDVSEFECDCGHVDCDRDTIKDQDAFGESAVL